MKIKKTTINLDAYGMLASTICAIHCVLVPLLFTTLPLWGLGFLANKWVEIAMVIIALILGLSSLSYAYLTHYKKMPLLVLLLGFICIAIGNFCGSQFYEAIFTPIGGFTIAFAHFINWRYVKLFNKNHTHNSM